jgi:hypothetical protein
VDEFADEVQRQAQDAEQPGPTGREDGSGPDEATAPVEDPPEPTRHPEVDEVLASLGSLGSLPVAEHVRVFEAAHDRLRSALADAGDDRQA